MDRLAQQEYVFSLQERARLDDAVRALSGCVPVTVIEKTGDYVLARMEFLVYASVFCNGRGDPAMPSALAKYFLDVELNDSYKHT